MCLFCDMANGDKKDNMFYEDDKVVAILDLYPESDGHTLVIPKKHYTDIYEVPDDILMHMFNVSRMVAKKNMDILNQKSIQFHINYGEAQAIKHIHLHSFEKLNGTKKYSVDEIKDILK